MGTTGDAVKQIIETDLTADQIAPFIVAAHQMVIARIPSGALAQSVLDEIERWLTAHLLCTRDPRAQSESIGKGAYSVTYQGKTEMGLMSTFYGQTAVEMDTTGSLAQLGSRRATIQMSKTPAHGRYVRTDGYG